MKYLEFEPRSGVVVQLKSGGFSMTVEDVSGETVQCVWADKGRIRRDNFPLKALKESTEGTDMILIMEGLNATSDEIADLREHLGNA